MVVGKKEKEKRDELPSDRRQLPKSIAVSALWQVFATKKGNCQTRGRQTKRDRTRLRTHLLSLMPLSVCAART